MTEEYALMRNGIIVNVVMTARSISEIKESFPEFTVKRIHEVSTDALERYQYWSERP